jgi:glycosyltransferase involved in cell wall biosynthesis
MKAPDQLPLVSCIMPTHNRRKFIPRAIRYFLRQNYPHKELVIVDDGTVNIADLIPIHPQIRYIKIPHTMSLGEKRNFCVRKSKGDLIMHWDDDDWMAPYRISYQVAELIKNKAEVCGVKDMYFYDLAKEQAWLYKYYDTKRPWIAGGSLLYTRKFWQQGPFPNIQVASDTVFIFSKKLEDYVILEDINFYVASIHHKNTSPKRTSYSMWSAVDTTTIKQILKDDWADFIDPQTENKSDTKQLALPPYLKKYRFSRSINNHGSNKARIGVLITTYKRPEMLAQILEDLEQQSDRHDITCLVLDDEKLQNGKQKYWETINTLWEEAKKIEVDYYFQLPDDIKLEPDFLEKSIRIWNSIKDPDKICLNLLLEKHRMGKTCWTNFWPEVRHDASNRVLKAQWVDMLFISGRNFFEELGWQLNPIPLSRWQYRPKMSSGVGQQISTRLYHKWNLYQTTEILVEHLGKASMMNPETREEEPMSACVLPKIYAGMASIPGREAQLRKAINSILPYIDQLFLFLNDYPAIPSWLVSSDKITVYSSESENTNMGDAGKFYALEKLREENAYFFSLDDDCIYPQDYIWKMVQKIEYYERQVIVGCGGYQMKPQVNHFYRDRRASWHINLSNEKDRSVHILHTCLTAWHTSAIDFGYQDCQKPNMGDIWLGLAAQKQKVPMILIENPEKWVQVQEVPPAKTIYGQFRDRCEEQTQVFNSISTWQIHAVKP